MNEADGSPGGGSDPAAQAAPPAQSAAPASPTIPVDAIKDVLAAEIKGLKDGIFADLRKAGVFKQERPAEPSPASTAVQPPASQSGGLSMADVEALLERERVITARATKNELSDAQIRRMKAALSGVAVESFAAEVDSYLADMKLVRVAEQPTTVAAQVQVLPGGPPVSDKGSPAPGSIIQWEREFAEKPHAMSQAAIAAMDAKYGREKARRMRIDAVNAPGGIAERLRVTTK